MSLIFGLDYILDVYYNDKLIIKLGAKYCGGYDNVVWYELKKLIDALKNKEITKAIVLDYINSNETYFIECTDDSYINSDKIDFTNQLITTPTKPIYSKEEFIDVWDGYVELLDINGKYHTKYDDDCIYPLKEIEYADVDLLMKDELSFDEFDKIYQFYDYLQDIGEEFYLNKSKFLKFNII